MASTAEGDIDADMGDKAVGDLGFPPCVLAGRESTNFGEISNEIARRADRPFGPFCTSPGDNPFELDADSNASGLAFAGGFVWCFVFDVFRDFHFFIAGDERAKK